MSALRERRAPALQPLADNTDPNAKTDRAPDGTVSSSQPDDTCAADGCDQSVVPGSHFCGVHQADGDKSQGAPNGGPDGSLSDGTAIGGTDSANGYQDGTLRQRPLRKQRHGVRRTEGLVRDLARSATSEFRLDQIEDQTLIISGLAIVYGTRTVINDRFGQFGETIQRGAAAHLIGGDVRLLANHAGLPLARTMSTTLALSERSFGVTFAAALDLAAPFAQDVSSCIKRGDLSGCSFAFTVNESGDSWNTAMTERVIRRFATLPEISVVTFPAYDATSVTAAQAERARARREQMRQQRNKLHAMTGVPMEDRKKKPDVTKRDDLAARDRTIREAGQARRLAMRSKGVKTYRSLRAKLNGGRDLEEIR